MKREEFDKLVLMDQIEYINKKLEEKSLTELCKEIKISRKTVRERFLKQGYLYNKNQNKYVDDQEETSHQNENKNESNTKLLEMKLKALETRIEALEQRTNDGPSNELYIKDFECDTVSRCYRLYEEVQKEFSSFCKRKSNYKVQDILSMALLEYMENHK